MNIFVLSKDPDEAAIMQCDQHVVKMPLETAQLLCTAYPEELAPYKRTHYNHPCNLWLRESRANYEWLVLHGIALCTEYSYRFGKNHSSEDIIFWCFPHMNQLKFSKIEMSPWPKAMDDKYKKPDIVESYRNFYNKDKSRFATWSKNRSEPSWFKNEQRDLQLRN